MGIQDISKKMSVVAGAMTFLMAADVPADLKMKYVAGLAAVYIVCQAAIDIIKAIKGRKPTTGSNAPEVSG